MGPGREYPRAAMLLVALAGTAPNAVADPFSPIVPKKGSCPCFYAEVLDGRVAALGPEAFSPDAAVASQDCFDDPTVPSTSLEIATPTRGLAASVFSRDREAVCRFETDGPGGEPDLERSGLSVSQAYACRTEIVNSRAWDYFGCPMEPGHERDR